MKFGKLNISKVSECKDEFEKETKFTEWLSSEGKGIIEDALGIKFYGDGITEKRITSNKRIDILFEIKPQNDESDDEIENDLLIVESQFNKSDHDHLGKLISYASVTKKVKYVVWTVEEVNEIHIKAIEMLNNVFQTSPNHNMQFYLFKSVMYTIKENVPAIQKNDDGLFAVNLELIKGPDVSVWKNNKDNKQSSDTPLLILQQNFWASFKEFINSLDNFENDVNKYDLLIDMNGEEVKIENKYLSNPRKQHWSEFRFKDLKYIDGYGSFSATSKNNPRINLTLQKDKGNHEQEEWLKNTYSLIKKELQRYYNDDECYIIGNNNFKINANTSTMYLEFLNGDLETPSDELFKEMLIARERFTKIIKENYSEIFMFKNNSGKIN